MQYQYTAEQSEFKDSLRRFVQDHYDYESRREYVKQDSGYVAEHWRQLAELGVLGLPFAEQYGGLDTELAYLMAVAEEFGRGLVLEPVFSTVALAGRLLAASENEDAKTSLLPLVCGGEQTLALAWEEKHSGGNPLDVRVSARNDSGEIVLSGAKAAVLGAPSADKILVTARDEQGSLNVYLIDPASAGVTLTSYVAVDGGRAANLLLTDVRLPSSAALFTGDAGPVVQRIIDEALIVLGAEAMGAMDQLLAITVEYCQTRKQFGLPIAAFQALQHRIADMYMACEKLRSLLWAAQQSVGTDNCVRAVAMLKAEIGKSGRYVGQQAVQLHGGIGMTDELNVGAYFKRLTTMDLLFGGRDYHLGRIAGAAAQSA